MSVLAGSTFVAFFSFSSCIGKPSTTTGIADLNAVDGRRESIPLSSIDEPNCPDDHVGLQIKDTELCLFTGYWVLIKCKT